MALIFVDGCDSYTDTADLTTKWDFNSEPTTGVTFNATAGRFGQGAVVVANDGEWLDKIIPLRGGTADTDDLFVSFSFKLSTISRSANQGILALSQSDDIGSSAATSVDGIYVAIVGGNVTVFRDATTIATGTFTINANTWYRFEGRFVCGNSDGEVEIRINETGDINATSIDTFDSGQDGYNVVKFGSQNGTDSCVFDDIVIHDISGTDVNGFIGDLKIETLRPIASGDSSDSTVVGGPTRHDSVGELGGADDDTTYVSMDASDKDLYSCSQLTEIPASITAVAVNLMTRADGTTPRQIRGVIKSDATEANGATQNVDFSANYKNSQYFFYDDPDTAAAWEGAAVNLIQIGQEVVT